MKFTPLHIVLILFLTQSISCGKAPCNDCGDPVGLEYIKVKIVNNQGQNLIFGPFALYNADSIRVLEQKNNLASAKADATKVVTDSTLLLRFYKIPGKNYIYYNQQTPPDSMEFKFSTTTVICCGRKQTYANLDSVIFNNTPAQAVDKVCFFVK